MDMHPTDLIAPSKTLEVDALAKKLISEGKDVVNLTAGEPDFPTPKPIVEKAIEALEMGYTKYTDSNGLPALREAISKYLKAKRVSNFLPMKSLLVTVENSLYSMHLLQYSILVTK